MITITSVLSLFTLLAVSSVVFFISKRIKIPYTVLLVVVGLLLVPLSNLPFVSPYIGFIDNLRLTPELLFYIFLPILIFESAFNMNIRRMVENIWSISALAVLSLLVSTAIIASGIYFILPFVGLDVPFIIALLFASIISSTDPVAVLALFKEFGAPKRLTLIFEGESLFNDGTAVALFLVFLTIAEKGFHGSSTVVDGILMFLGMVFGGIILGLLIAFVFSRILRYTRSNEFVAVTILIVSAHITFILGELINANGIFGMHFHVSSIIATTVTALFLGNYSRHILSPRSDEYIEKSIGHLAFIANSLVFILIGILFVSAPVSLYSLWLPIVVTILIVASARAISIYSVVVPLNKLKIEDPIPKEWQHLLSWGSLRGALAIIVVLLIPTDYVPAGWSHAFTPQELLLALTIGCILATLFIKALTIGMFIRRLKVNTDSLLEQAHKMDLSIYSALTEESRFVEQKTKGFLKDSYYQKIKQELDDKIERLLVQRNKFIKKYGEIIFEQSLHLIAVDIEKKYLQDLYVNNEIGEKVYRRITGKLALQKEKIETACQGEINPSDFRDKKDIFDRMVAFGNGFLGKGENVLSKEEQLTYYRAQSIIARKVLTNLEKMQNQYSSAVFFSNVFDKIVAHYSKYRVQASDKMEKVFEDDREYLETVLEDLSRKSLHASRVKSLEYLAEKGIIKEPALD